MASSAFYKNKFFASFSSLISVKDFKEKMKATVDSEDMQNSRQPLDKAKIASDLGISEETAAELEEVCSATNLKCPLEPEEGQSIKPDLDVDLDTIRLLSTAKCGINPFHENNRLNLAQQLKDLEEKDSRGEIVAIEETEVMLSVALYHDPSTKKIPTRAQEFLCLGKQTLTALRDKIYCPADYIVPGEHSEQPDLAQVVNAKEMYPSGFFFIENVFYNDSRDETARDYSKIIIDWVNQEERYKLPRLGVYTSKKMEETRFEELSIKLGYPYLYCHQGNCEHLVIFRDLRVIHTDDQQNALNYPLQVFRHHPKRKKCSVCDIYSANWLTRNDALMTEDPALFCEKCFRALHYKDEQKLYEFKAFQFAGEQYW